MAREIELVKEALEFLKLPVQQTSHNELQLNGCIIKVLDEGQNCVVWSIEDLKWIATRKLSNKFNKQQEEIDDDFINIHYDLDKFGEALDNMIDNHDAEYGITWETLDYYVGTLER